MKKKEQAVIKKIKDVVTKIDDMDKGYLMGVAEQMARESEKEKGLKRE